MFLFPGSKLPPPVNKLSFLTSQKARCVLCSSYETSIQPVEPFRAGVVLINNSHDFTSGGLINKRKTFVGNENETLRDKRIIKGTCKQNRKDMNKEILLESGKTVLLLFSEFPRCNMLFRVSAASLFFRTVSMSMGTFQTALTKKVPCLNKPFVPCIVFWIL